MSLSQNEIVWVRLETESVFEWISEKKTLCLNPTQQNSRWLPSSSWVRMNEWRFILYKMAESKMAHFNIATIIKLSQNEWVKFFFVQNGWNENGRFQDSCHHQVESEWMSEVFFVQNGWNENGRFQDSCHHQVESEWMSEVFFLYKMAEMKMADFKIAAIIKLSQNEQVKFFCANSGNQSWQV